MRARLGEFACIAVLLTSCAGAAAAEEQLVMPFACRVDGERVMLSPAPAQAYRVFGAHERRNFTACSRTPPRRCRDLDLHRFELDCGGAKVSWLSLVAALAPWMDKPNPIRAGRMQVDVGPRYYGRAAMPCVVPMPYAAPGRFGPPGFYGPRLMLVPCPGGAAPRQMVSLPAGFAPVPKRLVSFTTVPDRIAQETLPPPPAPVAGEKPKAPPSATAAQAAKQSKPAKPAQTAGSAAAKSAPPGPSAQKLASAESEITGAIQAPGGQASAHRNLIGAIGLGFAALLLFSTAFFLSRRRSRELQLAVSRSHEPIDARPAQDDWLPSTLGEALGVLVANPETDRELLKELVKTLRRRWHPDHAQSEEDRRARERKLKQINVDWDIVCGKRRPRPSITPQAA